jgi:uncharacterized protein involved in exopolysaccharide biosynthesis
MRHTVLLISVVLTAFSFAAQAPARYSATVELRISMETGQTHFREKTPARFE